MPKRPTYSRPDVERTGSGREENKAVEARRWGRARGGAAQRFKVLFESWRMRPRKSSNTPSELQKPVREEGGAAPPARRRPAEASRHRKGTRRKKAGDSRAVNKPKATVRENVKERSLAGGRGGEGKGAPAPPRPAPAPLAPPSPAQAKSLAGASMSPGRPASARRAALESYSSPPVEIDSKGSVKTWRPSCYRRYWHDRWLGGDPAPARAPGTSPPKSKQPPSLGHENEFLHFYRVST